MGSASDHWFEMVPILALLESSQASNFTVSNSPSFPFCSALAAYFFAIFDTVRRNLVETDPQMDLHQLNSSNLVGFQSDQLPA